MAQFNEASPQAMTMSQHVQYQNKLSEMNH